MGRQTLQRANHKTNKRMSIFRYSQIRSYKSVPNDFFVELKRYFVTQGFKIKRFNYTETAGQMVGRKDGWHLNFVPKFVLDIKQVNGIHFITFNYFARVRKIGIATGIATQGITALVGAATITGYLAAARNFVDAVGKAMDVLAGTPISVEWVEKEEADAHSVEPNNTNSQNVTYNTTNIQNVQAEPVANTTAASRETVVEHHHHYYYGGAPNTELAHPPQREMIVEPLVESPKIETIEPAAAPQRLAIMPSTSSQPFHQCDLEKELLSMYERGEYENATSSLPPANSFYGGSEASINERAYDDDHVPSSHMFYGGAAHDMQTTAPNANLFAYEDEPVPQYNMPSQHAPLYSIEPMSYKQMSNQGDRLKLEEIEQITAAPAANPFFDFPLMGKTANISMSKLADPNDPFSDLLAPSSSTYGYAGR